MDPEVDANCSGRDLGQQENDQAHVQLDSLEATQFSKQMHATQQIPSHCNTYMSIHHFFSAMLQNFRAWNYSFVKLS